MNFAQKIWDFENAKLEFEGALERAGFEQGEHYKSLGWDDYDTSIEFYGCHNAARMNAELQNIVYDAGFSRAFVNHDDGWETHYSWDRREPFKAHRGWRRRWVEAPEATTTRSIGEKVSSENAGYYEISYWPEG